MFLYMLKQHKAYVFTDKINKKLSCLHTLNRIPSMFSTQNDRNSHIIKSCINLQYNMNKSEEYR